MVMEISPPLLHYKVYGEHNRHRTVPLVLLHGLLGELDNWQTQAKRLAEQHYVISIDLRNHGHSPHIKGMSYREMAEDIRHLLHVLHIPRIDLLGHSMGGKVAMYLALYYPDLIQRLIVVDIAPKSYPLWHQTILQAMLTLPLAELTRRKEADFFLSSNIPNAYERGFLLKNLQRHETGHYQWKCNLPEIARHYLKIARFPQNEQRYEGKVVFIKGELSTYLQPEDRMLLAQYFPQYHWQVIKQAGHLPHVEQPHVFYQLVKHALATN